MEVTEKKFPSQRHRLLPGDDVTLTSHQHSHHHHHHHHNYRHDHHRRPLLRSSSSLLRNLVSPVVCLLLCVLVNPVLVQTPRARSQHLFRFRGSPDSSVRRNNTSALSSTPAENVVRTAAARYLIPATDRPLLLPSRTTTTTMTASNMTTTTTRSRRRPSLRKILEGEDVYWTTRRRSTTRPTTTESSVQRQPMLPIVARMRVEPVAAAEFRRRLKTARSYRDVIRIFVRSDERLRDEDIDDFITSPLMTSSAAAEAGNNSNSAAAAALQSIIVGSSGRQSIEDNRLPTNEWEMTLNHYTEMQNLGDCRLPVPKFIQVRNHELARSDSDYLPECTVVYRCHKEFGCCNSTSECGVKTSTYVYRPFWEITCLPNSNCSDYPVVPVVKTFPFVNHTECECKPIRHLPRCLQCPLPFENGGREEFGRCNCSCDAQHQHCLEISSGVIPLATDEINCVRESTCERPFCTNGEYDVNTGFCPCPEDTPDCRSNHESQTQSQEDEDDDDDDEEEIDDYVTTDETVTTATTTTTTTTTTATTTTTTTSNEQLTTEEATNSSSHDQQ